MDYIRRVQYCPHCGNHAPQKLLHVQHHSEKAWSTTDDTTEEYAWSTFVAECETCHHVLLYDNKGDQLTPDEFHRADLVYPGSRPP